MDYDYSKRNYLLPEGCKDLIDVIEPKVAIDVIEPKTAIAKWGFVVTVSVAGQQSEDIQITADGNTLHIIAGEHIRHVIEVPAGFEIDRAQATYSQGELQIVVPKAPTKIT